MATKRKQRVEIPVNSMDIVERRAFPKEFYGVSVAYLENIGFEFGDAVDEDFVQASYPEGWRVSRTHLDGFFRFTDHLGRPRGVIIIDGGGATAHFVTRFKVETQGAHHPEIGGNRLRYAILDGDDVYMRGPLEELREGEAILELWNRCMATGAAWLQEKYPDYKNAELYWEE